MRKINKEGRVFKGLAYVSIVVALVTSCAPDVKTLEKTKAPEVKEVISKPKKVVIPASSSTISAKDMIDYRDVDIDLLASLIHDEINKVKRANKLPTMDKNKVLHNAATDQNNYQIGIGDLSHTQTTPKKQNLDDRIT